MATVSEVLHGVSGNFVVHAGAAGLGREVRRILLVGPPGELIAPVGRDDLVVYSSTGTSAEGGAAADRAIIALLGAGVAGVLTNSVPTSEAIQAAEIRGSPLVASSAATALDHLHALLVQALDQQQTRLGSFQADLQIDLARLVRAGATPAMLLERLVEETGKASTLQATDTGLEMVKQPILQELETGVVRRALDTTAATVRRWMQVTADATVANVLYLELPADRLVRLVAPVWANGEVRTAVSLVARSVELTGRDRVALMAAARAIGNAYTEAPWHEQELRPRPYGAVVLRVHDVSLQELTDAVHRRSQQFRGPILVGRHDVRTCLPYRSQDQWHVLIDEWHAELSAHLGTVSIGYTIQNGGEANDPQYALVQAAEAVLLGDDLFGPGQITSYADAQLARFLLDHRQPQELSALYERAIGKLAAQDHKLLTTLEVYCETVGILGTAKRLGIHRNTVLYRLKLIEEITGIDLDDGSSRLLLQLGLLAGRLARRTSSTRIRAPAGPHLVKVSRRPKAPAVRTA